LPNNSDLQFNYSNRVNRPRGQQINPFKNFSDSTNITYGNPNLAPQYSSSLELNYIKSWDAQTLSASLYYHNTDNVIQNVRFLNGKTMESTYFNVANSQNTGLELISKNRIFRILNLTSTFNMYYSKLDSGTYKNPYNSSIVIPIPGQSNFSWSANVMANFMLSKTFSGQITAQYASPQLIAQGTEDAKYSIDLGVRQTFMNRNMSVSLNVRDLLNSDRDNQTTSGSGFSQKTSSYFHGRMIGLTLSYNFGNMKPKQSEMKKKEAAPDLNIEGGEQ
jgi:outer membrane receptor protein involved in Fe transport